MNKILLVDGNSILNRAFYGLPDLTNSEGRHTNAVLGFLNIVLKVIDETGATNMCVAFDVKQKTFRHEMFAEYKGTRKPMPDELREQLPLIKEVLTAMNVTIVERGGYEADDILGTLSKRGEKEGYQVYVLSGDRDLLQLATKNIMVKIPKTKAGKTEVYDYFWDDVIKEYSVDPITFIDMKGLMGDTSDNIPGVPGIGEKTAAKLLTTYGSLVGVYERIDEIKAGKMKDNLVNFKEQAFMSKELATIKLDCDIDVNLEDTRLEDIYNDKSYEIFTRLELKSIIARFGKGTSDSVTHINYELLSEYDEVAACFNNALKAKAIGYVTIMSGNEVLGCGITFDEKTYLIRVVNFITDTMISDFLKDAVENNIEIRSLDIKKELEFYEFPYSAKLFDCGIGAYLINPLVNDYEYDTLGKNYANILLPAYKELVGKKTITEESFFDEELCEYMACLAYVPYVVAPSIVERLKRENMYELYYNIELPCTYTLYHMEKEGIKVDGVTLKAFGEKLLGRIDELISMIYDYAGVKFNINSTKQLGEILFEKLALSSGKKTKTGYSTSVEVLEKIKNEHPIIPLILEYRQLTKLNSTYVEGLSAYISDDGRIHGKFNQKVTATGRISSTEPNLQNIPTRYELGREIRKVFVPKDGCVFLDADYSQIELRVLAHLSDDKTLIEAYTKDRDIHTVTASEVFGVPIDEVTSELRRKAKAVNFGIVYGISSFGLGQDLDISRKEAEGYIAKYFATYTGLKGFLDKCVLDAKTDGYSLTMFDRRRPIPELSSSNFMTRSFGERAAMNSPVQGTAADIIKLAMIAVDRKLKENNLESRLVLQVHDELIIETKKEELEQVKNILISGMEEAANLRVPLVVDVNEGASWYDAK